MDQEKMMATYKKSVMQALKDGKATEVKSHKKTKFSHSLRNIRERIGNFEDDDEEGLGKPSHKHTGSPSKNKDAKSRTQKKVETADKIKTHISPQKIKSYELKIKKIKTKADEQAMYNE